jgi:hypothetical protein
MNDEEEREMVGSELLRMLEDVANREIPCMVAYADIQKRIATARAEGYAECQEEAIKALTGLYVIPDFVPAPPNEKPKIGKETCKTYSESWCKGQDCRVCQFNIPGMGPAEEKP